MFRVCRKTRIQDLCILTVSDCRAAAIDAGGSYYSILLLRACLCPAYSLRHFFSRKNEQETSHQSVSVFYFSFLASVRRRERDGSHSSLAVATRAPHPSNKNVGYCLVNTEQEEEKRFGRTLTPAKTLPPSRPCPHRTSASPLSLFCSTRPWHYFVSLARLTLGLGTIVIRPDTAKLSHRRTQPQVLGHQPRHPSSLQQPLSSNRLFGKPSVI